MVQILNKENCCGCEACVQICPKQCIAFNEDAHGFRYPKVDESVCINCGLCEKVCPVLNQNQPQEPVKVYAAKNTDEQTRLNSSSGGIFNALAEAVIEEGGVVFGAAFDKNWEVLHIGVQTKEDLIQLRGSKYVQSRIGDTFRQVKAFLNEGRKVLFSGTSCQIAGLNRFLVKEYADLITVEVVCHAAPSPAIWRAYLEKIEAENKDIKEISFRDKSTGWKHYSFVARDSKGEIVHQDTHHLNLFMQMFLCDLSVRPSCFACPAKEGKSGSDITLADYWNIEQHQTELNDDKGISLVLTNTAKGADFFGRLELDKYESTYSTAVECNPCLVKTVRKNRQYEAYWTAFLSGGLAKARKEMLKLRPKLHKRVLARIVRMLKK